MNLAELERKLIAAARAHPPSERVPYAFEKRILACLASAARTDQWDWWARALWRAAAPCMAIALLLGVWSWMAPQRQAPAGNLSQALEQTLLAAVDQEPSADSTR